MSLQTQHKVLSIYFIIHQIFGLSLGVSGIFSSSADTFVIYMFSGFPVYGIKYNIELFSLSSELEIYYPRLYSEFGFLNPITNKVRVVLPSILFKKELPVNSDLKARITLTKWCLIFTLLSIIAVPIMAILTLYK